jgi:hypothetical protein
MTGPTVRSCTLFPWLTVAAAIRDDISAKSPNGSPRRSWRRQWNAATVVMPASSMSMTA